jgi:hypothetical protein
MRRLLKYIGIIIVLAAIWIGVRALIAPPSDFPVPYRLTIEEGQSLFSISHSPRDYARLRA